MGEGCLMEGTYSMGSIIEKCSRFVSVPLVIGSRSPFFLRFWVAVARLLGCMIFTSVARGKSFFINLYI